jgi:membrane associated rhomboid family serine protease
VFRHGRSLLGPSRTVISLRDGDRPREPVVTGMLVVVNLLLFWYTVSLGETRLATFLDIWGVVPRSMFGFFSGTETHPGVLVTPLTSMYLHVGGLHLASNMLYLWVFGSAVEQQIGRRRFLAFYTACGLLAAGIQVLAWRDSTIPAVGASGAIAGLLAAYLVLRPGATVAALAPFLFFFPAVDVPAVLMLGLWFLSQFFGLATLAPHPSGGGVAWLAHLGGFFAGFALIFFFRPTRRRSYQLSAISYQPSRRRP